VEHLIRDSSVASTGPDKNIISWLKVVGCFLVFVNTWGITSSFGVYQAFYEADILSTYSPSSISWIGTVQVFLLRFTCIIAGLLYNRGYSRSLLAGGFLLVVFGLCILSLVRIINRTIEAYILSNI
jgi:hypothetical protein